MQAPEGDVPSSPPDQGDKAAPPQSPPAANDDRPRKPKSRRGRQALEYRLWAKAIDTQMHFNLMCARARQLGLAFVTAAASLGVALVANPSSVGQAAVVHIGIFNFPLGLLLILACWQAIRAFKILDLNVYHHMLRGAVAFAEDLEKYVLLHHLPNVEKGMTQAITHFSRKSGARYDAENAKGLRYVDGPPVTAKEKIEAFYDLMAGSLKWASILIFISSNTDVMLMLLGAKK